MKEDLISFKTAKLAKEKGFDWECNNWWVETLEHKLDIPRSGVEHFPSHEPRILGHKPSGNYHIIHASAPTQSLLQKWLREEHNIHCIVSPVMGDKNGYDSYPLIGWRCDVIGLNKDSTNSYYMGYPILDWFTAESLEEDETLEELNINRDDTYEEALEQGLQEALKLI